MDKTPVGRFAPTPSGRMHLGNLTAALIAWLGVRSQEGTVLLRMEDLDTQRTSLQKADLLRRDLQWLGLDWDRETPPQSTRTDAYIACFEKLREQDLLYPCYCTRSQLHSVNAPHLSDGTFLYPGTCRNLTPEQREAMERPPAWRLRVPDKVWHVTDLIQGPYQENLVETCGDFLLRRADGAFLYQLAVTVDDGEFGVTQVVRGWDLLSSAPRQMYLQSLLGFSHPQYAHIPLLVAPDGRRLSKREKDLDMEALQRRYTPQALVGLCAYLCGLLPEPEPVTPRELIPLFSWDKLKNQAPLKPCHIERGAPPSE